MSPVGHTKGTLKWCGCGKCGYIHATGADARDFAVAIMAPPCGGEDDPEDLFWGSASYPTEERNSNARRFTACWNALLPLTTEEIEAGAVQELVEALRLLRVHSGDFHDPEQKFKAVVQADATLAKWGKP